MVSVLVVDDQETFRRAMIEVVEATDGFALAAAVDSGEAALSAAREHEPGLAIADKRMPGMDGYELCGLLTEQQPGLVVVLVSIEDPDIERATAAGAVTVIHKRELSPEKLREVWARHTA
jgi:two-component system, NarL family, invasion response regulator UvrY